MRRIRIEIFTEDDDVSNQALGMTLAAFLAHIINLEGLTVESFDMDDKDVKQLQLLKNPRVN